MTLFKILCTIPFSLIPSLEFSPEIKNRITYSLKATVTRSLYFNFGNPAIPGTWDPWLSVPQLLVVWLYRFLFFNDRISKKYTT
jgi:hypothetical protein